MTKTDPAPPMTRAMTGDDQAAAGHGGMPDPAWGSGKAPRLRKAER